DDLADVAAQLRVAGGFQGGAEDEALVLLSELDDALAHAPAGAVHAEDGLHGRVSLMRVEDQGKAGQQARRVRSAGRDTDGALPLPPAPAVDGKARPVGIVARVEDPVLADCWDSLVQLHV